jgi:hypothetical protein
MWSTFRSKKDVEYMKEETPKSSARLTYAILSYAEEMFAMKQRTPTCLDTPI